MSGLSTDADLRLGLVTQENALICCVLNLVCARDTTSVATSRIDGKGAVDVTPCLVELNGLPGILSCLTDARALNHAILIDMLRVVATLHVLGMVVSFYLILTESQRKVQFKRIVVLSALRLMKSGLVRVGSGPGAALCGATWILRAVVV